MRSLDLLACHLCGDFALQTPEQVARKLQEPRIRAIHVSTYHIPFAVAGIVTGANTKRLAAFLVLSWVAHFITDSRRWAVDPPGFPKAILADQALHALQLTVLNRVLGRSRY